MGIRASRPKDIPEWAKVDLAAVETTPVFVNLRISTRTHVDGFAHPVNAHFPDQMDYDHLRVIFGEVVLGGSSVTAATVEVWAMTAEGFSYKVGESQLTAGGTFDPIEFENFDGTFAVLVTDLDGSSPEISFRAAVQGVHVGYVN